MPRAPKKMVISHREIGERLRALRVQGDLTQARLAQILGTHQTNVSEMERGVRGITVQQLVRLARALKVSPNDLLGVSGGPNGNRPVQLPRRLLRRLHHVAALPKAEQQALLKIIDRMIEGHRRDSAG